MMTTWMTTPITLIKAESLMETISSELNSGVLTLTIQRPPVNALNMETISALLAALRDASRNPQVRCILLTGSQGVFSAGHDINEMLTGRGQQVSYRAHLQQTYNPLILQIRQILKPVIAMINGPAAGAGLGIALACDLRFAADSSHFTVGFAGIGLAPDSGVSLFLPVLVGLARATELSFSNATIPASQALEWGLINRVVPVADLVSESCMLAGLLANGPMEAFGLAKRAYNHAVLPNLEEVLDYEAHLQEIASHGPEHIEGVNAFIEKRFPNFNPSD
jgi:2-(1,2-epoxy-1,2-dihydrophenyl)acetyl-CoA isomerase